MNQLSNTFLAAAPATLAEVVSVDDPDGLNRVEVSLLSFEGVDGQEGTLWARVATPFAGADYGAFLFPNVGDEVLVTFVNGDPRYPVVVGSMWNGNASAPESLNSEVDKWVLVGRKGTRIAIEEETGGKPKITLETPRGVKAELTDQGGGRLKCRTSGGSITISPSGITVRTSGTVSIEGSTMELKAGMVDVQTPLASFSGIVTCNVMQATTVIASTYTPGAGNVW